MSRFFQVLEEASRWPQQPAGEPAEPSRVPPPVEIPPIPEVEPAIGGMPEAAMAAIEEEARSAAGTPFPADGSPEHAASGPAPSEERISITLPEHARLLPQVAESGVIETYRRLRTKILQQRAQRAFRALMVTSPNPQEGKTLTVMNLALSFAMLPSFRVLVVDGDLRRGSVANWLGIQNRPGLSNLIAGTNSLEQVILKCDQFPVQFIVRGDALLPAGELLNSGQLGSHFRRISEGFDLVLVDSPPVNPVADAQLLANSCDAVLLVARAFATTRTALEKAAQDLVQFRIIGTVLNAGTSSLARKYQKYY